MNLKEKIINISVTNKTMINNTLGAFFVKGGALIISLLTMPAYIKYFDDQVVLGLWFTMLSVLSWVLTFDLGIGNGLRNHLVSVIAKKDYTLAKKYISSAYTVIGGVVLIIIPIFYFFSKQFNWNTFFNISNMVVSKGILNLTVNIIFSGIMIQFFLKLITSVLYALQKSALTNLITLLSSIIMLIYVSFPSSNNTSYDLILLALVYVMSVNLPLLIMTIIIFLTSLKKSKPNIKFYNRKYAKDVLKLGGSFFWIQIMYMVITTTNEFIITYLSGPEMVVEYQVYNKLFILIGTVFALTLTPVWSAVTKAKIEGNSLWINKLYKLLKFTAIGAIFLEFVLILVLQFVIDIWLGTNTIEVNYLYAFIFAISGSIFIWNGLISSIANGIGELKEQIIFLTIGALLKIPIAFIIVHITNSWIGVIIANILSMLLYCIFQTIKLNKKMNLKEIGDEIIV